VLVGIGGVLAETIDDTAVGLAPLTHPDAIRLLARLRAHGVLTGTHGRGPVDLAALARVVVATGDLMAAVPEIAELDLNPVLATGHGCVAVDWRILVQNPPGQDE
jgi:hypothetical protein